MEKHYLHFLKYIEDDQELNLDDLVLDFDLPAFFDFFKRYIATSKNKRHLIHVYNVLKSKNCPILLSDEYKRSYVALDKIFVDASAYFFDLNCYDIETKFDKFISTTAQRLEKFLQFDEYDVFYLKDFLFKHFYKSFVIEFDSIMSNQLDSIVSHQKVSQYTMAILYLIIAEKMGLPIFGLPFEDKLIICFTKNHCTHNELVYEDDIIFYHIIGEKEISYQAEDIYMAASVEDVKVELNTILPKGNAEIVKKWVDHIQKIPMNQKQKNDFSIKYQQFNQSILDFNFI